MKRLEGELHVMNVEAPGAMWVTTLIPLFFIVGMFLAMLASSPKTDR
ncbi:MAG: hypothetical protein SFV51_07400 [Bryobacteraceae bacterium]|nr:hypothetical protein [Bryobacteraceae bacterium]